VPMFRGTSAGRGSGNWLGAGLFITDSKCITYLRTQLNDLALHELIVAQWN